MSCHGRREPGGMRTSSSFEPRLQPGNEAALPVICCALVFYTGTNSKNAVGAYPAVYETSVVSNLEPLALDRFNEVKILSSLHFAEHDVADFYLIGP